MSITWTKQWSPSDDGTNLRGIDLRNIQDDIDTGINDVPEKTAPNTFSSTNKFTGITQFGSDTDNTSIAVDGTVTMSGAATVWDDLQLSLTSGKVGATDKPDYDYTNNGYLFPQNDATEILYLITQMPHAWKEGSDINPHIHWAQSATTTVGWKIQYKWINIGDAIGTTWTTLALSSNVATYTSGTAHQISAPVTMISGAGKTISSLFLIKLYREDNTTTGDVLAHQFDIHYERNSLGSKTETTK